jgi:hypothetical protein
MIAPAGEIEAGYELQIGGRHVAPRWRRSENRCGRLWSSRMPTQLASVMWRASRDQATGMTMLLTHLVAKELEVFKEALPQAS